MILLWSLVLVVIVVWAPVVLVPTLVVVCPSSWALDFVASVSIPSQWIAIVSALTFKAATVLLTILIWTVSRNMTHLMTPVTLRVWASTLSTPSITSFLLRLWAITRNMTIFATIKATFTSRSASSLVRVWTISRHVAFLLTFKTSVWITWTILITSTIMNWNTSFRLSIGLSHVDVIVIVIIAITIRISTPNTWTSAALILYSSYFTWRGVNSWSIPLSTTKWPMLCLLLYVARMTLNTMITVNWTTSLSLPLVTSTLVTAIVIMIFPRSFFNLRNSLKSSSRWLLTLQESLVIPGLPLIFEPINKLNERS